MRNSLYAACTFLILLLIGSCGNGSDESSDLIEDPKDTIKTDTVVKVIKTTSEPEGDFIAANTKTPLTIDGIADETAWTDKDWYSMNYKWMGSLPDSTDYYGRFKLAWDTEYLYILAEVADNILHPTLKDGIDNYWKGDYVEIFIDEDQSGGDHKYNHQAFAYHVSTEGHSIDKSTKEETIFFDEHIDVARTDLSGTYTWEMAVKLYDASYNEESSENKPVQLSLDKTIGFSIGYGDNDGNQNRENFMGSKLEHGINNDEGYTNSSVFGSITFK